MKILNIGSLNLDMTYMVSKIATPGETIESKKLYTTIGGKGLNQSIALSRARAEVYHMGLIGEDGERLRQYLNQNKVDITWVEYVKERTGHAVIQVDETGENCILLYHGANFSFTKTKLDAALSAFKHGILVLQNEINEMAYIIEKAYEYGMYIVLNPSPITKELEACDLTKIQMFILNEKEAYALTGQNKMEDVIAGCRKKYPQAQFVMTCGKNGSLYFDQNQQYRQAAYSVDAIDTTGAGDTFLGYFVSTYVMTENIEKSLRYASIAAALSVTRIGAAQSIPTLEDVERFESEQKPCESR